MVERFAPTKILLFHFFRRFFDNDTIQAEGDTVTTIARALAVVTIPSLLVAFFQQNQYPQRQLWGRIEDQYFFVLLSFVVMGAVTIFEWEMLFPDRADFLVLTPLPLVTSQLMVSKALALVCFLLLFLTGTNLLGAFAYPAICHAQFAHQVLAHTIAVTLAGAFSSGAVLASVGLLRLTLSDRHFRVATPGLQLLFTTVLALLVIQYARYGSSLQSLLGPQWSIAKWVPPFWFLGMYDAILYGASAPMFASESRQIIFYACCACLVLLSILYPLAWTRMQRMSVEGALNKAGPLPTPLQRLVHTFVRRPAERAMFHFLGQTLCRNPRYQIYLAMYGGTGLALAAACACVLQPRESEVKLAVSRFGSHAVIPLLCFWSVAGLRTAFAFPTYLPARWIFRISGADSRDLVAAAWKWMMAATSSVFMLALLSLYGLGWTGRTIAIQIVSGSCLSVLLVDVFLVSRRVPMIEPRLPGKSNFALYLTLYIGVLTPSIFCVIWAELRLERNPWLLLPLFAVALTFHVAFRRTQRSPIEVEEEMQGYEGEFQLLNLR